MVRVRPDMMVRRDNLKKLRQLAPLAISNGWLRPNQREDDAAIFEIWKKLATGALMAKKPAAQPRKPGYHSSELGDAFRSKPDF